MKRSYALGLAVVALAFIGATTAVPLSHLSLDARRQTLPDTTLVSIGKKTVALAVLRHAHAARQSFAGKAADTSAMLRRRFRPSLPTTTATGAPIKSTGAGHPVVLASPTPISLNLSGIAKVLGNTVLEPPSQYASTPADMKAFCQNAWAAACVFLPPQQPAIQLSQNKLLATDTLIDRGQCDSEGGTWSTFYGGVTGCGFLYPDSATVHFRPASNYKLSSSAQCDSSWWTYTVDPHGAISISLTYQALTSLGAVGVWGYAGPATGSSPWCVVYVTKG